MKEITQLQIALAVAIVCIIALSAIGLIENHEKSEAIRMVYKSTKLTGALLDYHKDVISLDSLITVSNKHLEQMREWVK